MFEFIAAHPVIEWSLIGALLIIAGIALTVAIREGIATYEKDGEFNE